MKMRYLGKKTKKHKNPQDDVLRILYVRKLYR